MIASFQDCEGPKPPDFVALLVERFRADAISAKGKDFVGDLTEAEACAICFFAGVPYVIDIEAGRIHFDACTLHKRGGAWTAYTDGKTGLPTPGAPC